MGFALLGSPRPRGEAFPASLGFGFCSQPKNKRGETQHRKQAQPASSQAVNFGLFLVFGVKGKKSNGVHRAPGMLGASILADAEPPPLPLPAMGTAGAQPLAWLSVIPALPRLVSALRTQTAQGSLSDSSGSPHTSAFLFPVKYSRHSSRPHQFAAKSLPLSLLVVIWKLGKNNIAFSKERAPSVQGEGKGKRT